MINEAIGYFRLLTSLSSRRARQSAELVAQRAKSGLAAAEAEASRLRSILDMQMYGETSETDNGSSGGSGGGGGGSLSGSTNAEGVRRLESIASLRAATEAAAARAASACEEVEAARLVEGRGEAERRAAEAREEALRSRKSPFPFSHLLTS